MKLSNIGVIVSARMGSTRLPGKAMLPLCGMPMLKLLLTRLIASTHTVKIVLATTQQAEDDVLCELAQEMKVDYFRGDTNDLIHRYLHCAKQYRLDYIVRVTADCPFVDGITLDYFLEQASRLAPFTLATTKRLFPIGIDFELFETAQLEKIYHTKSITKEEKEHLTLYFYNNENDYLIRRVAPPLSWQSTEETFTIDTLVDYQKALALTKSVGSPHFKITEILNDKHENKLLQV